MLHFKEELVKKFKAKSDGPYDNGIELKPDDKGFNFCVKVEKDGITPKIAMDSVKGGKKYELGNYTVLQCNKTTQ